MSSKDTKKILIAVLRYSMLLAILAFGGWYVMNNYDRFVGRIHLTAFNLSALVFLCVLTILLETLRLRLQVKKLGHVMSVPTAWHVFTVMQAVNHLVVKAGTFSAGYYLSKRFKISFHAYCAFVMTYVVIMVLSSGLIGLLALLLSSIFGAGLNTALLLFFSAVIAMCVGFIALASIKMPLPKLPGILVTLLDAWREIYSDYRMIASLLGVEMLYFAVCSLRFYLSVRMLSVDVSYLDAVTVVTVGNFLRVASIIPGGLGIAELASGWTSAILGGDAGISGLAAGFDRLIYVIFIMLFGGVGFLTLSGRSEFHRPEEGI